MTISDIIVPFELKNSFFRGKIVKLNKVTSMALSCLKKDFSTTIRQLYVEMLVSATVIADDLKFDGSFKLQFINGEGTVKGIFIDIYKQGYIRATLQLNKEEKEGSTLSCISYQDIVKDGNVLVHVDHKLKDIYQSIISIDQKDKSFTDTILHWYKQSAQVDTIYTTRYNIETNEVVAIFLQKIPNNTSKDLDVLNTLNLLSQSLDINEVSNSLKEILYKLYNSYDEVIIYPEKHIIYKCKCSKAKMQELLDTFPIEEIKKIRLENNNKVVVTCDFCNTSYEL